MSESLSQLLLRLSEGGPPAIIPGAIAKDHFGSDFDSLLHRQTLVELEPMAEWSPCGACECEQEARSIHRLDGRLVAACPLESSEDIALDDDDIRRFEICIEHLIGTIAEQSGCTADALPSVHNLWQLSIDSPLRTVLIAPCRPTTSDATFPRAVRLLFRDPEVTLLAPAPSKADRVRMADAGIEWVELAGVVGRDVQRPFAIVLPVSARSGNPVALMIDVTSGTVVLHGDTIQLTPRSLLLLTFLATAAGRVVKHRDIEQHIWGKSVVGKLAVADAVRGLRKELGAHRIRSDGTELIQSAATVGYRLALEPSEVDVRP